MVSLFHTESARLRSNHNEVITQFPNYLYDPYAYPSNLTLMDYQWNLFYPQSQHAIQTKRKRKLKEQNANERIFKEMMPCFEYKREEIIDWLKSLTIQERLETLSIQNEWLTSVLVKMYRRWANCDDIVFALLSDNKKTSDHKNGFDFTELEVHFSCRRKPLQSLVPKEQQDRIAKAEKEIVDNLKLYDSNELYDTVMLSEAFVRDIDNMIDLFDLISESHSFNNPCKLTSNNMTKSIVWDVPFWFSSNSFQTFPAWLVSHLERAIWVRYFEEKISSLKSSPLSEKKESRLDLKYKNELVNFWKNLEKNNKKKLLASVSEVFRSLKNEKEKNDKESENDINQKLKLLFDALYNKSSSVLPDLEGIVDHFQMLLEEKENERIDEVFLTPFGDFGTIRNLICRKFVSKVKNMLSEKIAVDLIMNEEKEKISKKKNNKKKKASPKKQNRNNVSSTLTSLESDVHKPEEKLDDIKKDDISDTTPLHNELLNGTDTHQKSLIVGQRVAMPVRDKNANKEHRSENITNIEHPLENQSIKKNGKKSSVENKNVQHSKNNEVDHIHSFEEYKEPKENSRKSTFEPRVLFDSLKDIITGEDDEDSRSTPQSCESQVQSTKSQRGSDYSLCSTIETKMSEMDETDAHIQTQRSRIKSINSDNKDSIKHIEDYMPENKVLKEQVNVKKQEKTQSGNQEDKVLQWRQTKKQETELKSTTGSSPPHNEIDTTDSESGVLLQEVNVSLDVKVADEPSRTASRHKTDALQSAPTTPKDNVGFIEVKPKRKRSVKPNKSRKETQGNFRKKQDKNFIENPLHEKDDLKKINHNKNSSKVATNEAKKADVIKKPVQPQASLQPQTSIPKTFLQSEKPAQTTPCLPVASTKKVSAPLPEPVTTPAVTTQTRVPLRVLLKGKNLSLASPSIDFEALLVNKMKTLSREFFETKFKKDIYEHVASITEKSNKMMHSRILVYKRIDHCIAKTFPTNHLKSKIFGSCATGLALVTSDVDIAVSRIETYDKETLCEYLSKIDEVLKSFKWVLSTKPIKTAHVPVLKLEIDPRIRFSEINNVTINNNTNIRNILSNQVPEFNLPTGNEEDDIRIKVDLTLESLGMLGYSVHMGYKSTDFAEKMLQKYESLYIITMTLKEFLYNRKLLNTFQGGISSYCLIMMIVAVLQTYGDEGYMSSLMRIFKFYGQSFQPENTGITLSETNPFFPLNHCYETAPLWILDHNDLVEKRNVGQGAYSIKMILHEFEKSSNIIDLFEQKLENLVIKHKDTIQNIDDIGRIDDPELKSLINSNILDLFITPPQ